MKSDEWLMNDKAKGKVGRSYLVRRILIVSVLETSRIVVSCGAGFTGPPARFRGRRLPGKTEQMGGSGEHKNDISVLYNTSRVRLTDD